MPLQESAVVGEETPVRLGLIIAALLVFLGGVVASVWWAATISTKLDSIILAQTTQNSELDAAKKDIQDIKAWQKVIDATVSAKMTDLEKQINDMRHYQLDSPR